jgi:hypothetical protein
MIIASFIKNFPWSAVFIGIGAILAGVGSVLTGMAAYRAARRKNGNGNGKP